ncbi:hypothetical protein [Streptomyces sp. bgisy153]|uniref:hypothetical protein n=1 Tax=Streptomyces sp. bgisy153 TaxID=3413793 RepID=UPI003D7153AF
MLFSIPESGWWLITLGAMAVFMIAMPPILGSFPVERRGALEEWHRRRTRRFRRWAPVVIGAVLGASLLGPVAGPSVLFLCGVVLVSLPVALFPVRGRVAEATVAQLRDPGARARPDRLLTAWICGFLSTVLVVAVVLLTTAA